MWFQVNYESDCISNLRNGMARHGSIWYGFCWDGVPRGRIELNLVIVVIFFLKDVKYLQNVDAEHIAKIELKGP